MYYAIIAAIWFATFAMTVQSGLWANGIVLAQIVLSGLIAFGCYQPLSVVFDEATGGEYTYLLDFIAIWLLYCLSMLVLKIADGALSKTRMRFQESVEKIGGPLVGLLAGWVMVTIVLASLHAAPLAPDVLGGALQHKRSEVETKSMFTAPDLFWLRLVGGAMSANSLEPAPRRSGRSPASRRTTWPSTPAAGRSSPRRVGSACGGRRRASDLPAN